ncbi:hypothetical protein CH54_3326 [Yersinia rochesterensis]|uniref:Type VI secretion system (T6SS), amidase effector protein 4 n=1 Tax=Yersinia rochesterensis TaxID=1604335 RepID=A0ABN4FAZ7_9GAMM|nr:T6SS effector amidase Tae4 family protein [Yersinia rochesterensis]AIN18677.1 hypothetical protein DJ57_95 [Yersinia rochesterensis]AJI86078.1 hypothetical protein AW19_2460 [Yersinia frederiksenii Y225]AJJ34817.1 hypothetical protein CH54_3326 [Yersinia rochesterensis]
MNQKTVVKPNNKTGSVQDIKIKSVYFDELWSAYPSSTIKHIDPKSKDDIFSDHCAINVSQALYQCGILMKSFKGARCWNCPTPDSTGKGIHAIRAQELSDYLKSQKILPFAGGKKPLELTGKTYEDAVSDKTGLIFFQDYWLRSGEKSPTGDHIDLWKNNKLASLGWLSTWARRTFPQASESYLSMSDLRKSTKVLFWEIL